MNLHALCNGNVPWIWIAAFAGNGRHMGHHLWQITEGEPPTFSNPPDWMRDGIPSRYAWTPYHRDAYDHMRNGWIVPLCGLRSRSRRLSSSPSSQTHIPHQACRDCEQTARDQGILYGTITEMYVNSPVYIETQREYEAWIEQGRPLL